ncbi:alpha/beta hydrolase [Nocardioides sp. KIGAM211]|uniref:Alpha/beta hydrolase n=1 Tax=Nocardioides luti TaxID=2761101 RepID=A0A7X0RGS8_9ACTN|nr:alpha/beta fold hydrolase [Nocardioides luti]MBB6626734.1 alpha/beta hydrolase [Nocardioides luti]
MTTTSQGTAPAASRATAPAPGPTVLDALSLLSEVADELVVRTARDTHFAVADRINGLVRRGTGGASGVGDVLHRGIATAVYGGLSLGLRAASKGLDAAAATGVGPRLEDGERGRFVSSAVNGLIGDRLLRERPQLAIPMGVRAHGRDVPLDTDGLDAAFPAATGQVVVFLHGLCENEDYWRIGRERTGQTYGEALAERGWTPVYLRANTGLPLRENGVALSALLQRLVEDWPVEVTRIALVGHSMGGLIIRAAGAVASVVDKPWTRLVSDVVTLGTPHLGAPIARGIGHGSRGMARLPETSAFGRILDWRSVGVHDLVAGLAEDVAPLPHARYRLVAGTVTASERHPVGHVVGDYLVRTPSAYGRDRYGAELFPGAEVLHVGRTDHFGLLNHPDIQASLARWLA